MKAPRLPSTASGRAMRRALDWRFLATLIIVLGLGWVLYTQIDALRDRTEASAQDRAALREKIAKADEVNTQQQTLIDELTRRCENAEGCIPPPVPEAIRGERGDPGLQGPVGPPGPRGESCVEELGLRTCRGDDGANGSTGEPGANGTDGAAGKNGADGKDGAQGPQGEPGPAGPTGPPGRGIQAATCGDDGHWHITYTDGTTDDAGICRVAPIPNGDPTP